MEIPNLGSSCVVCVCVGVKFIKKAVSPFPQTYAGNEQWLDCRLRCEMSAVCLFACDMSV